MNIAAFTKRFQTNRRGAIAMMFGLCLVPLVLLVGLAIDYAFYVQSSQQASRAAAAAATQAVRTAAAGYALDIANNKTVAQATSDSITEGEVAGQQWFAVQASSLVRGTASTPTVLVVANSNGEAGFAATVNYSFSYPPFFNVLFGRSTNWVYPNSASAQAVNQYIEVVLLLDTSNSMLIGAGTSDIAKMSQNSVCFPTIPGFDATDLELLNGNYPNYTANYPYATYQSQMAADNDEVDLSQLFGDYTKNGTTTSVHTYIDPSGVPSDTSGTCNTAHGYGVSVQGQATSKPGAPCALACHTSSTSYNGNFADPYGQARALGGVTLREDVVLSASEQVAQNLYSAEQSSNQFTLGVYQFNNDVSTMVEGGGSDALPEATDNLTSALTTIEKYDYAYKGNSALLPALTTSSSHNTNFPLAIRHLVNGTGSVPQLTQVINTQANPAGSSATNPIKNIFIVTDGFEDSSSSSPGGGNGLTMDFGEMTSKTAENDYSAGTAYNGSAPVYCSQLKALGFNVYVLYVAYYPVPITAYYDAWLLGGQANDADQTDFPSAYSYGNYAIARSLAEATSAAETDGTNPDTSDLGDTAGEVSPNEEALQACASNGDFHFASSASDITKAMTAMLRSAINSSIILTR
jgi:Flp pilus assembly protein TadG